ncbi:hypothetical protein [Actinomycetospora aeridis]|uniref:PE family protein n=1 Tax=Actinomycetospora aeridis TaxID=3129231 RepID=A0ABU8N406_9PSEU
MSAPQGPGEGGGAGEAAMRPDEARAFAGKVDALEQGVLEAQAALDGLGAESLAVGSGEDNAAIASWYRELVTSDTVPAARTLATELAELHRAIRESAVAWEQADADAAASLRPDPGPV